VLVAFLRFATDPDYLHRKLAPLLIADITIAQARDAHAAAFRAANVRVGRLSGNGMTLRSELREATALRDALAQERDALCDRLAREAKSFRVELDEAEMRCDALARERDTMRDRLATEVGSLRHRLHEAETQCAAVAQARDGLSNQVEIQVIRTAESELGRTTAEDERDALRERLEHQHDEQARLVQEIFALRVSRSWRATRPLRALASILRADLRR
jgi:chromosome segregation ATPase